MNPSHPSQRRRRQTRLATEALEPRELLTGGAGDTFAIVPGTISKANQPAVVKFTIDPTHFNLPKGRFTVGIDIAPGSGSTVQPKISSIDNSKGRPVPVSHSKYSPGLNTTAAAGSTTSAVTAQLKFDHTNLNGTATYTVNVRGLAGTTGQFLLGFYLPGDADGDGKVTSTDLTAIEAEKGVTAASSKYTFDADANRDGRINATDISMAKQNLGVVTTISPTVSAQVGTANQILANSRNFSVPATSFSGTTTPDATITFQDSAPGSVPLSATSDSTGNYSINVPLVAGTNTFSVTTLDAFGQSITGSLQPVTYSPPGTAASTDPTPTPSSTTPPTTT